MAASIGVVLFIVINCKLVDHILAQEYGNNAESKTGICEFIFVFYLVFIFVKKCVVNARKQMKKSK